MVNLAGHGDPFRYAPWTQPKEALLEGNRRLRTPRGMGTWQARETTW